MNSYMRYVSIFLLWGIVDAIDLMVDDVVCDEALPAYAMDNHLHMECSQGTRCTFGQQALIFGDFYYAGMNETGLVNNTGYVSADLELVTLKYKLFEFLPFNFCGDWVKNSKYNFNTCPEDGKYYFEVPYTLPNHYQTNTWLATGWEGITYISIFTEKSENSELLAQCKIHLKTFVTESRNSGWTTPPSAAQATIAAFAVIGALFACTICLSCRRPKKLVTDEDYSGFMSVTDDGEPVKDLDPVERSRQETPEDRALQYSTKMGWG